MGLIRITDLAKRAGYVGKRFLVGAALISCLSFGTCATKEHVTKSNGNGEEVEMSYINFNAYWAGGDPAVVNVYLYKANSNQRLMAGGTNPEGDFYSLKTYPTDQRYEIFLQDIGSRQCLDDVTVNFNANPPWPTSGRNEIKKSINVGPKDPMRDLKGCKF